MRRLGKEGGVGGVGGGAHPTFKVPEEMKRRF